MSEDCHDSTNRSVATETKTQQWTPGPWVAHKPASGWIITADKDQNNPPHLAYLPKSNYGATLSEQAANMRLGYEGTVPSIIGGGQ
jgi:hypothetical protein